MNNISLQHIALIYLAVINMVTFFVYGIDKWRSTSGRLLPTGRKNGYTLGGRQFIERFKVGLFVPMHFTTGFESAWRFKEFTEEKDIPFWAISREGETIGI